MAPYSLAGAATVRERSLWCKEVSPPLPYGRGSALSTRKAPKNCKREDFCPAPQLQSFAGSFQQFRFALFDFVAGQAGLAQLLIGFCGQSPVECQPSGGRFRVASVQPIE